MNNPYVDISSEEFIRTFSNALKKQLDMGLTIIQIMVSRDFAERLIVELDKKHDECT